MKAASRRARWAALACIMGAGGCATASRESAAVPDAAVDGSRTPADAAVGPASDADAGPSDDVTGSFGHCCVEQSLFSCFCPTGATCRFGVACDGGGCVEGDGSQCGQVTKDGAVE